LTPSVLAIGIVVITAGVIAILAKLARQPIVPAYILAGVIVGPIGLKLISDPVAIQTIADLAIVFVMFAIGLEMDLGRIKSVGKVVTLGGFLQVAFTGLIGFGIALYYFNMTTAIYITFVFAFASTTLVVKQLSDRRQLDTIQGGIVLGILLLQDIIAIIIMSVLPAQEFTGQDFIALVLKTLGLVFSGILCSQYVFPRVITRVSDSAEIMALASLAVGFGFGFLAESQGLSISIGAFITGVSMANLPCELELQGRVKSIRDFFLPIFFAALGVQIVIPGSNLIVPIIVLTAAALTLKPLVNAIITAAFGYQRRVSYNAGVALVPISEFGLIIVAVGIRLGHIQNEIMTLSIVVMALSMLLSAYLFNSKTDEFCIARLVGFLDHIGPDTKVCAEVVPAEEEVDVVLIGLHRAGRYIWKVLSDKGLKVLVVEYDYRRYEMLVRMGIRCIYGDGTNPRLWEQRIKNLTRVTMVVSTLSDRVQSFNLLNIVKERQPDIKVVLSAEHTADTLALLKAGASYVLCAQVMAGLTLVGQQESFDLTPDVIEDQGQSLLTHLEEMVAEWEIEAVNLPRNGRR